ncbi:MAG: hypothetical protein E7218_08875, partial [Anaerofustis stercorihominis]|nr:hypothetical protein [Anaerofustis stercorihominis]
MNMLFMNLLGRLQGYSRVRVMPGDSERFFNSLAKCNIGIWDIKEDDGRIFFNVRGEDMPYLYEIAEIFRTSVVIEKKVSALSILSFMKRYKYRIALLVCAFLLIIHTSSYIWEVNIYGASLTDEEELRTFVYENGYKSSMSKSELDKSELELLIKTNFPYITSVVSDINGISLDIKVYESEAPLLSYNKDIPVDIVAVKDCIIDEIVVFNGTAKV